MDGRWTIIFLATHFPFRRLKLTAILLLLLLYCTWLSIRFGKAFYQLYGYRGSLGVITHHNACYQRVDKLVSCTDCILGTKPCYAASPSSKWNTLNHSWNFRDYQTEYSALDPCIRRRLCTIGRALLDIDTAQTR